ncbi:endoglucanase [Colletotrichum salicis]|uniref:Endoglucanase n=1 Tax=Colletotrichum salicis TaxID=1209931 RepID=A0A135SG37_9PEZI|nr:endoglucanase [Colletotrichum salicis]
MISNMNQIFLLASMLASMTLGHVVLENPKPFKFIADGPTNPISSTGDDFPCKIPSGASYIVDGAPTVIAIGETFEVTFKGQAVHGGGSCQFALSADANPTKDSKWMVIHSIEGGCPARNQKGNLEGPNEDKYPFKIPASIAPGDYVFAWIWLARVGGQPEYYMNCAPITVTGGGGGATKQKRGPLADRRMSLAKREEFPELFMANIGEVAGGCTTGEALNAQVPIAFPNRGLYFDRPEGDNLYKQACDGNPNAGAPVEAPAGGDMPAGTVATSLPTSGVVNGSPLSPPVATSVPTSDVVDGSSLLPPVATDSFVVASSSIISPEEPAPSAAPADPAVPIEPTTPAESSVPAAPTVPMTSLTETAVPTGIVPTLFISYITVTVTATDGGTSAAPDAPAPTSSPDPDSDPDSDSESDPDYDSDSCTEGYLTCLEDETHFATCTGGELTAPQPIALGFKCAAGEGQGLEISPIGGEYQ